MSDIEHGSLDTNGITIHYASQGDGPLVVLCHGFPESWYSWRHQLPALAEAGYRAVAPSMRGYGKTSAPTEIEHYSLPYLVGDMVGLVQGLGESSAVIVGHDWGAPVAWYSALMRPTVFRAVAGLSVPVTPPIGGLPEPMTVNDLMRLEAGDDRDYYRLYFQEPGKAEAELEADIEASVRGFLYTISGDAVANGDRATPWDGHFPAGERAVDQLIVPDTLPPWLTDDDVAVYVEELRASGFRGGLNWYRNIDRLPGALAPWVGATIDQPSLYIGGSADLIAGNTPEAIATMQGTLGDLRHCEVIEGAGHWIQQEHPEAVNAALIAFLAGLG